MFTFLKPTIEYFEMQMMMGKFNKNDNITNNRLQTMICCARAEGQRVNSVDLIELIWGDIQSLSCPKRDMKLLDKGL